MGRSDFEEIARRPSAAVVVLRQSHANDARTQKHKPLQGYMRSGTDMPSSPNPVFNTLAVTPANANLEERISSSDFRMGQAS